MSDLLGFQDIFSDTPNQGGFASGLDFLEAGFGDVVDAEFRIAESGAVQLAGNDLLRFRTIVDQFWSTARINMHKIHAEARRDRRVYNLVAREAKYDGAPCYTTPMSANKADGIAGHLKEAIEQPELYDVNVRSLGAVAEYGALVASTVATYLNREIEMSSSREIIASDVPQEVSFIGTAVSPISVSSIPIDGEFFFQLEQLIPLEHCYFDRLDVDKIWKTNFAYLTRFRLHELQEMAEQGILAKEAVDKITYGDNITAYTFNEMLKDFDPATGHYDENRSVEVRKGYLKFRPEGARKAIFYEYIQDEISREFLSLRPNPFGSIFDSPPIPLWRIGKQPRNLLGRGILRRLATLQSMMDNEINNYFAVTNLISNPPMQYRSSSPFGQLVNKQGGHQAIIPGMLIPTLGTPKDDDLKPLQFSTNPNLVLANVNLVEKMGEDATFTNQSLGNNSRASTLGQFQVEVQKGSLKVRLDMADLAYDGATAGKMLLACAKYKIGQYGVVEVYEHGNLLALKDIHVSEFQDELRSLIFETALSQGVGIEELLKFQQRFNGRLIDGYIPGAHRGDLSVSLKGTKIIADKVAELNMLMELSPYLATWLQPAYQDSYMNYHLRSLMTAMGIKDIDRRMPQDPHKLVNDKQTMEQMMMQYMEYARTVSAR